MRDTLVLSRSEVAGLATMARAVEAVESAFRAHGEGTARMPAKVYLPLPEHDGDLRAMPAYLDGSAGVKWVNSHPNNPARHGLPSVMGVFVLSDPATAYPLAIMDATWLTALRTGAAAAVASRWLARPDARSIGFVGCGVQARTLLAAHRVTHPALDTIVCADAAEDAARRFAEEVGGRVGTVADAASCDIVCTSTPSFTAVVPDAAVRPGAHINAMGADAEGKQELELATLRRARVFVDDMVQATHSGETQWLATGHHSDHAPVDVDGIAGTIGQVITGAVQGRASNAEGNALVTLFDSTGLAIQDVALARALYDDARAQGVGTRVSLVD